MSAIDQFFAVKFWYLLMHEGISDAIEEFTSACQTFNSDFSYSERIEVMYEFCEVVFWNA
jgi:hypothetical protein